MLFAFIRRQSVGFASTNAFKWPKVISSGCKRLQKIPTLLFFYHLLCVFSFVAACVRISWDLNSLFDHSNRICPTAPSVCTQHLAESFWWHKWGVQTQVIGPTQSPSWVSFPSFLENTYDQKELDHNKILRFFLFVCLPSFDWWAYKAVVVCCQIKHFVVIVLFSERSLSLWQTDQTADPGTAREPVEDVAKVSVLWA